MFKTPNLLLPVSHDNMLEIVRLRRSLDIHDSHDIASCILDSVYNTDPCAILGAKIHVYGVQHPYSKSYLWLS